MFAIISLIFATSLPTATTLALSTVNPPSPAPASSAASASSTFTATPTPVVMQLDWIFNAQFAGLFVAEAQGYFATENLAVEIRPKVQAQLTVEAVFDAPSGEVIFGCAESNVLLQEIAAGVDLRLLATMFQDSPMAWMFKDRHNIRSIDDFTGKRIGVHPGDAHPLQFILRQNQVAEDQVEIVTIGYNLDSLLNDEVDLKQGYVIDEYVQLDLKLDGKVGRIMGRDFGYTAYSQVIFTRPETLLNHPEATRGFLRATKKGWIHALANPEQTVALLLVLNPELDPEHQRRSLALIAELVSPHGIPPLTPMSPARWQASQTLFHQAGLLPHLTNLSPHLDLRFNP